MLYRLQLTYGEIVNILEVKYFAESTIRYALPPGIYAISNINLMLKSLLPGKVEVKITIHYIRLKSNITNNKTIKFSEKSFLYYFRFHGITLGKIR